MQTTGPICGRAAKGVVKCPEAAVKLKATSMATRKLTLQDPIRAKQRQDRFEETMISRYGVKAALQSSELSAKIKQTTLERYGVECGPKIPGVFDAARKRCLEDHGVTHWTQRPDVKQSKNKTCKEKFGFENPIQSPEVIDKRRSNNLIQYGVPHPQMVASISGKRYNSWIARQGTTYGSPEYSARWQENFLKTNGVDHPSKLPEVRRKWLQTVKDHFGELANAPLSSPVVRAKYEATMLDRYGVVNPTQSSQLWTNNILPALFRTKQLTLPSGEVINYQGYEDRVILQLLQFYTEDDLGFRSPMSFPYTKDGLQKVYHPDITILKEHRIIEVKSTYTFMAGIKDGTLVEKLRAVTDGGWQAEVWIWEDFKRSLIIDFLPLQKQSVNCNIDRNYQREFRVLKIFEDEIRENSSIILDYVFSYLTESKGKRVDPDYIVEEFTSAEARKFLDSHHYLGAASGCPTVRAVYQGQTIGVWVFQKRYSGEVLWHRACWDHNYRAWNPHEKALKLAIPWLKDHHYSKITTFADLRWHTGELYEKLGFQFEKIIDSEYYYSDGQQRKTKYSFRVPAGISEIEEAAKKGWHRVFDIGKKRFVLSREGKLLW
jgi:hypothetical protein